MLRFSTGKSRRDPFPPQARPRPAAAPMVRLSALIAWACLGAAPLPVRAAPRDQEFVEGLRERRLFELVEVFCRERLSDRNLSDLERTNFVIEQIRSDAEHAVHSAPRDRPPLWRKAREAAAQFVQRHADSPRLLLVQFQDALTVLAEGELARQEAEAAADDEALGPARETLRLATRLLEQLDKQVSEEIPRRRGSSSRAGELSDNELFSLQHHVQRQLARARRNQALCYPKGSNDRVAALAQAVQQLEKPLTQLPADDPLVWELRIDQLICYRLLADFAAAQRIIASLEGSGAPPPVQLRARAEAVRLALDAGELQRALQLLSRGRDVDGTTSAELDFAQLETCIALWREAQRAGDAASAKNWRDKSLAMVRLVEQTHGSYWARRAELLLVNQALEQAGGGDWEVLSRTADQLYLQGLWDEAIEAYARAAGLAQEAGDAERTFELLYKAALVEQKRGDRGQLARRLRTLATSLKSHPQASQAHFLAIGAAVEMARSDTQAVALYEELLQEHLATWPDGKAADTVRLWLGRLYESRGEWPRAIDCLRDVRFGSEQYASAVEAAARCWLSRLDELQDAGEARQEAAQAAEALFEEVFRKCKQERNEAAMRQAALAVARIRLRHRPGGHAAAERALVEALEASPDAPVPWKTLAHRLLVVALAGQEHRLAEADALLKQIENNAPQPLLEMLMGLSALIKTSPPPIRAELGKLQLSAADLLSAQQAQLDERDRRELERFRGEALAAVGRRDEALAAFATLARENPRDARLQEEYGQLLLAGEDRASLEEALRQWRRVARGSRSGSERWYRAKYSVALAQFKLGDKQAAAELISYIEATAGLDSTELKPAFDDLRRRCRRP